MLEGNRCVLCQQEIKGKRSSNRQTKYCLACARLKKRENSLDPWHPLDRRDYMRLYMRQYRRRHPRLSAPYVRIHREREKNLGLSPEGQTAGTRVSCLSVVVFLSLLEFMTPAYASFDLTVLSLDGIQDFIARCVVTIVEASSLVVIALFSWRHIREIWRQIRKDHES